MAMQAETIEQVIDIMDGILEEFKNKKSRLGFFYVTLSYGDGIGQRAL
ncbi:MAG: hypothetical protein Q9P01_16305 [Anaerolineae bacterium]|nr:hypothetical protein [Anaerolineae bacterium]